MLSIRQPATNKTRRATVETIGYIGRALSSHNQWNLNFYLIQALTLLVAPALLAASIYMILGRIIRYVDGEECSPIPARYLTKIFVAGDVLASPRKAAVRDVIPIPNKVNIPNRRRNHGKR